MNKFSDLPVLDKIATVLVFLGLLFWGGSKIPFVVGFSWFALIYEVVWLYMILITLLTTFYFLFKWIDASFKADSVYGVGFLIGVITLVIMRFV